MQPLSAPTSLSKRVHMHVFMEAQKHAHTKTIYQLSNPEGFLT